MPSHIAAPNQQNIPRPGLRSLPPQRLIQLLHQNLMPQHRTRRLPLMRLPPSQPIHQHAPPHDPTPLTPPMYPIRIRPRRLLMRQPIVVFPRRLVRKVL